MFHIFLFEKKHKVELKEDHNMEYLVSEGVIVYTEQKAIVCQEVKTLILVATKQIKEEDHFFHQKLAFECQNSCVFFFHISISP